ncbi:MAG: hypothetical protein AAGU78_05920 [Chloroflexota bacterium]|jgi:hypothetical protein|nr:hypothetical protein [Anaerolineae bacterium]
MRRTVLFVLLALGALALAACADSGSASGAIEAYLKAKVEADAEKMVALSCAAWEAQALEEAASFKSVRAELEDMACEAGGEDGDYTLVACSGTLIIHYGGEEPRRQPLGGTTYRALDDGGEWKMCGEAGD